MEYDVLYQDPHILVIDKPPGITVNQQNGLGSWLEKEIQAEFPSFYLCHRLDRFTSGVILSADGTRNKHGSSPLGEIQMNWHSITRKTYLAVIRTPNQSWPDNGILVDLALRSTPEGPDKTAATHFMILYSSSGYSVIQATLKQYGRTHQIRKHALAIGCPLIGDWRYGESDVLFERGGPLLHAYRLVLKFGQTHEFLAPVPNDIKTFFTRRKINVPWEKIENTLQDTRPAI